MLQINDKILLVTRTLFQDQPKECFVGAVVDFREGLVKVTGVSWRFDPTTMSFIPKKTILTQMFSLTSGHYDVYMLPLNLGLNRVSFEASAAGEMVFKDDKDFVIDISF